MYDLICEYELSNSTKFVLSDNTGKCRFCGQGVPNVTFNNLAHCISEFLGNKKIVNKYECDNCNTKFSRYESDFGTFTLLYRSLRNVKGKQKRLQTIANKVTSSYNAKKKELSIQAKANWGKDLEMSAFSDGVLFEKKIEYIPIHIYYSLIKYALSILPYDEFLKYVHYIDQLNQKKSRFHNSEQYDVYTIISDNVINNPKVRIYKNKTICSTAPQILMSLEFQNFVYNIFLYNNSKETLTPIYTQLYDILNVYNYTSRKDFLRKKNFSSPNKISEKQCEFALGKFR